MKVSSLLNTWLFALISFAKLSTWMGPRKSMPVYGCAQATWQILTVQSRLVAYLGEQMVRKYFFVLSCILLQEAPPRALWEGTGTTWYSAGEPAQIANYHRPFLSASALLAQHERQLALQPPSMLATRDISADCPYINTSSQENFVCRSTLLQHVAFLLMEDKHLLCRECVPCD